MRASACSTCPACGWTRNPSSRPCPACSTSSFDYAAPLGQRLDHFHAPTTLAELAALREAKPAAQLLAGSTDVGLWVNKQFRDLGDIIFVGDVAEMKTVEERGSGAAPSSTSAPAPRSKTPSARSPRACRA